MDKSKLNDFPIFRRRHHFIRNISNCESQENTNRMIAVEVLTTKFSQSVSKSEEQVAIYKEKHNGNSSGGCSSGGTSGGWGSNKTVVTSTTTDSIAATTATSVVNSVNKPFCSSGQEKQLHCCSVSSNKPPIKKIISEISSDDNAYHNKIVRGIPQHFKQQQQQLQKLVNVAETRTDNLSMSDPNINNKDYKNREKPCENSTEQITLFLSPQEVKETVNFHDHEDTAPYQDNNLKSEPENINISSSSCSSFSTTTLLNNYSNKSLPIYSALILKELFNSTNNKELVYLIHPFHNNFRLRSINKNNFINSFLQARQNSTGTQVVGDVFNEPQINDLTGNENHVWGIINKHNNNIHFYETVPGIKGRKDSYRTSDNLTEQHLQNDDKRTESNNKNETNSSTTEPPPVEKLTSNLPLKKRKVADSFLTDPRTPSPSSLITHEDSVARSKKSVLKLAEDCMRDRSVFIISPSDVPKAVKPVALNLKDDCTNQQLTKYIKIALQQDKDGDLPLHIATVQKDLQLVSLYGLLIQQAGKSVDRFNKKNLTPLHLCVKVKFLEGLKKLIQMGADVNALDGNGRSALHIAVFNSDYNTFSFMLQQCSLYVKDPKMKPNLSSHDYEGLTLLHTAVNNNSIKLIEKLLEEGAELDVIDFKSGRTPLFHAVENNVISVVEFLLEKNASVDIPNFAGHTAFLAANARGYDEISKLLAENGADTRGVIAVEDICPNPKTTSMVKSQLKNKLVSSKSSEVLELS